MLQATDSDERFQSERPIYRFVAGICVILSNPLRLWSRIGSVAIFFKTRGERVGTALNVIYMPATPFVGHPERAYSVAALFGALLAASLARSRTLRPLIDLPLLMGTVAWGVFGYNETLAVASGANIRIDLLFSWPILCIVTVTAIIAGCAALYSPADDEHPSENR